MADLFDTLRKKYSSGYMKFAEALLFRSSDGTRRSLRVEADSIGLEFTDNIYLGVVVIPPSAFSELKRLSHEAHSSHSLFSLGVEFWLQEHHLGEVRFLFRFKRLFTA